MTTDAPQPGSGRAWTFVFAAWLIAAAATLGALFFGEVMKVPTCSLCWYQRIFMFPLALLLPLALFPFDARITRYALPLAVIGWGIALFHVLLVEGVIPDHDREFLGKWTDMEMLIGIAARERNEEQYRKLYQQAGFRLTRVVETASPFSVVEGVAV